MKCPNGLQIGHDYDKNGICNSSECDGESYRYCRRYNKMCIDKADFGSKVIADRVARQQPSDNYSSYECPFCGGWHIGRSWK